METQVRPTALSVAPTTPPLAPALGERPTANAGWLVSPAFDLFFIANLGWLLALVPGLFSADHVTRVEFWQLYFLTTPHRWITLVLVALDPDRREGRAWLFLTLAGLAAVVVAAAWLATGAFLCLLLVDYIWNGWHFAAQHAGVLRIYSRKVGTPTPWLDRHGLRLFLCYVIARTAGWTTGWLEGSPAARQAVAGLDWLMLLIPATLLLAAVPRSHSLPRLAYLASVCGLYTALLLALHVDARGMVLALTTAAAVFHATEYLALVTHYARRRREAGSPGAFRAVAAQWVLWLAGYVVALGTLAALVQVVGALPAWWVGLNLWAAFLHYAYDGMIWKLRRPETARALAAGPEG